MAERELKTTEDVFDENMRLAELERNRLKGINNPTKKPKPFYISELPEKAQNWIKERTKKNFLKDGMSEKEAEQRANDFLDEKVYTAEETFGKDFWKSFEDTNDKPDPSEDKLDHEVVNDFSIDAIKDNFTPPGAKSQKEKVKDEIDTNNNGEIEVDEMANFQKSLDDYASKNKKGRDDIPVTTRR